MNLDDLSEWRKQRLADLISKKFRTNIALGKALGHESGATVGQWLSGHRRLREDSVAKIEELPGLAGWFDRPGTPSQRGVVARHPDDDLGAGEIEIAEYNVKFSGGDGNVVIDYELAEESEPATYRLSWVQRMRLNPEKLKRFKVKGDSMETLLFQGDTVLVNTAENTFDQIIDGKVYAIRYGNELRVKRLFRKLDGTLTLHSDNPAHKEEVVPPALVQQHITIIGRVRDKSGSGGL